MSTHYAPLYASLLIASSLTVAVNASANEAPYTYNAGVAVEAPVIDGILNDPVWTSAHTTSSFVVHNDGSAASGTTWAKLAYDQDYLYVAYHSQDTDITATFEAQDDPTFESDDTAELFLDPDGDGKNYYEIGLTPKTYYDYVIHQPEPWTDDKDWDIAGLVYASKVNGTLNDNSDQDQNFTIELKIPLASLNYTGTNEAVNPSTWRFNFHKADYNTGAAKWAAEWLAWSPMGSFGFHQPSKFATANFTDKPLWQQSVVYLKGKTVSYQGVSYLADYYSATAAPGLSSLDGWTPLVTEGTGVLPYNINLIYTKGYVVTFNGQQYKANWKTKGKSPATSLDWTAL